MIIYVDILSGKEIATDSYPESKLCDGAILGLATKKITIGGEDFDIGGNPSADGADAEESVEKSALQVVNLVHSHQLVKIEMDAKEAKARFKAYFKKIMEFFQKQQWEILGFEEDYKAPKDAKKAKKAIDDATAELDADGKRALKELKAQVKGFKDKHEVLKKFVEEEILHKDKFQEFEFFMPPEAELGNCAIIPARYVGEAAAPTFYIFVDCIKIKKA